MQEGGTILRELAADNSDADQLAYSLNTLSTALAEAGRREEGLAAIQEAVTILRGTGGGQARHLPT
ncbi:MAG: hypothetical protein JO168_00650 [Solirubrobacterales bacterium]|nr:hypothetical protein [Solirubrobacterales bacterium]